MSDPLTNVEIEDVLASIRRLVSAGEPANPPARRDPPRDRLVLTPALRVHDDAPPARTTALPANSDTPARDKVEVAPPAAINLAAFEVRDELEPDEDLIQGDESQEEDDLLFLQDEEELNAEHPSVDEDTYEEEIVDKVAAEPHDRKEDTGDDVSAMLAGVMAASAAHAADHPAPAKAELSAAERALLGDPDEAARPTDGRPVRTIEPGEDLDSDGEDDRLRARLRDMVASPAETQPADKVAKAKAPLTEATVARTPAAAEKSPAPAAPVQQATPPAAPMSDDSPVSRDSIRKRIEATIAELEAAVSSSSEDFEPDGSETPAQASFASRQKSRLHLVVTGTDEPAPTVSAPVAPREPEDETEEPVFESGRVSAYEQEYDEVEDVEPEGAPVSGFRQSLGRLHIADFEHGEKTESQRANPSENVAAYPDLDDDPQLADYLDGGALIDEEMLRDMVGQIVREELQGVLGERITRNVRKLVRREIHRILNSQDFE
ncbi:hypothetical protein [Pelagovum pacificum]|uniref:DUF2497 domain-containing protein n=1 Tax=Pelagovum pacificum TaxID=2588711 RepID=A0A5C5G9Z3_9RHOB|nr:hypothetical protein [Pelagovum pacificum]QQA41576.1 hypothetical protein I8N54_12170 [Pelagovum pacificum]TNY30855.1 hypothetical protein FHY64_17245 [Pelagovum pacificum]